MTQYGINIVYTMSVRKAISVTLQTDNVLWLKGQAAATARGSLSEVLDQLVTEAREGGRVQHAAIRSVKNSIDLPDDDPRLELADAYIRSAFEQSIRRPMLARERRPSLKKRG